MREAEASGATADAETFAAFVAEHLPPEYLDVLVDDMNASLAEIWEGACVCQSGRKGTAFVLKCAACCCLFGWEIRSVLRRARA